MPADSLTLFDPDSVPSHGPLRHVSQPIRILVLARDSSSRVQTAWARLKAAIERRSDIEVALVATTDDASLGDIDAYELAVVIGGDGAILRACRSFGERQIPILGVNVGRLGFLADLSPEEFCDSIEQIAGRSYEVVSHLMFVCEHTRGDGTSEHYLGLNEAAIMSAGALQMVDVHLSIGGEAVTTYSGDGLIISTPVGSTAHSLSAGGPILRQDLQAFVVTPICPHTLTVRPLVDSADCSYRITVPDAPEGVMLVIDGQIKAPFGPGDVATIRKSSTEFQLVRLPGHSFYGTLHRKLGWAGQPHYRV